MAAFASPADLATFIQRDLTAEETATAEQALDIATAAIRSYTGQTISAVANDSVTLRAPCGYHSRLFLPQLPVTNVASVTVAGSLYSAINDYYVDLATGTIDFLRRTWWGYPPATVAVVYSHGYATVPDDVRGVCLELAASMFSSGGSGEIKAESIGNYSVTYPDGITGSFADIAGNRLDKYRELVVA